MNRLRSVFALLDRHPRRTAIGAGGCWALILVLRLFVPSTVGMADQGDGHRLLCQLGLRNDVPWGSSQSAHVWFTWVGHRYYGETCGANGTGEPYYSSQLVLLRIAGRLTHLLGLPGALDLRALAVLCCLLAGVAIGWLVAELPGPVPGRVLVGLIAGMLLADSGVAVYFASPFSEPGALLGVLFLCPAILRFARTRTPLGLGVIAAIAAFTLTTKTQMVSLLPALVVFALAFPLGPKDSARTVSRGGRLLSGFLRRLPGLIVAMALVGLSGVYLSAQPERFTTLNQYNQLFGTILPASPDPMDDLRWFGLDPGLVRGAGSNVASTTSVAADLPPDFTERVSTPAVAGFYLTHPGRIWGLVWQGLEGATTFRPGTYLANYPLDSGEPPNTVEHRFEFFTKIFTVLRGAPILLLVLWAGGLVVFRLLARRGSAPAMLGLILLTGAIGQFAAVILTDGTAEMVKHQFIVDFMSALCLPIWVAAMLAPRRPAAEPGGPDTPGPRQDPAAIDDWTHWEIQDTGKPAPEPRLNAPTS